MCKCDKFQKGNQTCSTCNKELETCYLCHRRTKPDKKEPAASPPSRPTNHRETIRQDEEHARPSEPHCKSCSCRPEPTGRTNEPEKGTTTEVQHKRPPPPDRRRYDQETSRNPNSDPHHSRERQIKVVRRSALRNSSTDHHHNGSPGATPDQKKSRSSTPNSRDETEGLLRMTPATTEGGTCNEHTTPTGATPTAQPDPRVRTKSATPTGRRSHERRATAGRVGSPTWAGLASDFRVTLE